MKSFKYDKKNTYENNYKSWKHMNDKERRDYKQDLLTEEEGEKTFREIYVDQRRYMLINQLLKD
tara:strand:- start:66 stop:257 length:192 start_codon:yes stop_codon:yes gene_type:complete